MSVQAFITFPEVLLTNYRSKILELLYQKLMFPGLKRAKLELEKKGLYLP